MDETKYNVSAAARQQVLKEEEPKSWTAALLLVMVIKITILKIEKIIVFLLLVT